MNLHHLKLFLAVAEEGSVTRGAEKAVVSQPAVSRAVADLESSLGERLFDRGPKGVALTEAGRVLFDYAKRIFLLEHEAGEALHDLRGLEAGRLSIGASTTIGDHLLPPAIARFLLLHPSVDLSMEVANTEAIYAGVLEGRFDVGFTEGKVDPSIFEVRRLAEDELVVFCAPSHPLAAERRATVEELAQYPFVMREEGSGTRLVVETNFSEVGLVPRIACSLGSTAAIKSAVAGGLGIGIASGIALAGEVARGELVIVRTPVNLWRPLHRVRLSWRGESIALRRFMAVLETMLRR